MLRPTVRIMLGQSTLAAFDALRMEHHNDNIHAVTLSWFCSNQCDYQCNRRWLTLGHDDPATKNGLDVSSFCRKAIQALDAKVWESYFGRKKFGVYLKRLSQKALHALVIRSNVR